MNQDLLIVQEIIIKEVLVQEARIILHYQMDGII